MREGAVELHRHWKAHLGGPLLLLSGAFFLLAAAVVDYRPWLAYPTGAVLVLCGVLAVLDSRRRFLLRIDRYGVTWRIGTGSGSVPWHDVVGLAVERSPDDPPTAKPNHLTLWLREPLPSAGTPDVTLRGRVGYRLVEASDLVGSVGALTRALGWYAPPAVSAGAHARPVAGPAADGPAPAGLRPPRDGECAICGSTPAALVTLRSITSVVLLHWTTVRRAWWCRDCALANHRELTAHTLAAGWWGVGVVSVPVVLWLNRRQMRAARDLGPPEPTPGVAAPSDGPLDPDGHRRR
jgi:hypothetical protein